MEINSDAAKKIKIDIQTHTSFKQSPTTETAFTFIDLFAGIGGIRLPYQQVVVVSFPPSGISFLKKITRPISVNCPQVILLKLARIPFLSTIFCLVAFLVKRFRKQG